MRYIAFILFVSLHLIAVADDATITNTVKSTPWHLMDAWWDIGTNVSFERYEIDVTISADVAAPTRLYISPIGLGKLSGEQFYGGIQTRLDGNTKTDHRLRELGPGFIFSM